MQAITIYYGPDDEHQWAACIDRELKRLGITRASIGNIILIPARRAMQAMGGDEKDGGK